MKTILKPPEIPPEKIEKVLREAFNGIRKFALLKAALKLGFFEHLKTPLSAEDLASKTGSAPVLVEFALEALEKMGFLEKEEQKFRISRLAETYLSESSSYRKSHTLFWMEWKMRLWLDLEEIFAGRHLNRKNAERFREIIDVMAEECICGHLQETVKAVSSYPEFSKAEKLLDIGGGHGLYAIAFSMLNPRLKCFVFDLPEVSKQTRKYIERYKAKNVFIIEGDFFKDEIGSDYDIVFSSFNPGGKNPLIAEKIYKALKKGGLYVNKQCFPTEEKKELSLEEIFENMEWNFFPFRTKKSRQLYSFKGDLELNEYLRHLENLGFEILHVYKLEGDDKMLIARKIR